MRPASGSSRFCVSARQTGRVNWAGRPASNRWKKARRRLSNAAGQNRDWPRSGQFQFVIGLGRDLVATRAIGRSAAAVARDDTGLFALDVAVDPGHPRTDLVGEQADAERLDVIGP